MYPRIQYDPYVYNWDGRNLNDMHGVATFLNTPHQGYVLDDQLRMVKKSGLYWMVLSLLNPFVQLFGYDLFSHVRIHRVAEKILDYCQQNRARLLEHPIVFKMVKVEIIDKLNRISSRKYEQALNAISDRLLALSPRQPRLNKLIWPKNPTELGITIPEALKIHATLDEALTLMQQDPCRYSLEFSKSGFKGNRIRELFLRDHWSWNRYRAIKKTYQVPLSLRIISDSNSFIREITLLCKKKIGSGAQTAVRLCHALLSGRQLVRKNCTDAFQKILVNHFYKNRYRGITPILDLYQSGNKVQICEPLYPATLSDILTKLQSDSLATKISLIEDILNGIHSFHQLQVPGLVFTEPGIANGFRRETGPFRLFHSDINPKNILIDGQLHARLTDLGSANPITYGGTPGFMSPEMLDFMANMNNPYRINGYVQSEIVHFRLANGQASDIWSTGLVIAMILSEQTCQTNPLFPPIPSVIEAATTEIKARVMDRSTWGIGGPPRATIHPDQLRRELDELARESVQSSPMQDREKLEHLWKLVGRMLLVDPRQRIPAEAALEELNKIKEKQSLNQ